MNSLSNKSDAAGLFRVRRAQPLLGTFVEITATGYDHGALERAVHEAFATIKKIHTMMSFHESTSELTRINQSAHITPQRVSAELCEVLRCGIELYIKSEGVFDFTCERAKERSPLTIQLSDTHEVFFEAPLRIDLGGIAKGYAVDKAIDTLKSQRSIVEGMVNAGGDLKVFGDDPVPISLRHPENPEALLPSLQLHSRALATSATYFAQGSPIIDPETGHAWSGGSSVSVIAHSCMIADALTKVVALRGSDSQTLLAGYDATALLLSVTEGAVVAKYLNA